MQRKDLKKAIKEFSHKTNFYKLGLVKKYLKKQEKTHDELVSAIPKVVCPDCGSRKISVAYDESEYSSDYYLYCNTCDKTFDDTSGLKDAMTELDCESWNDCIELKLNFENPNIKTEKWKKFCEDAIIRVLG